MALTLLVLLRGSLRLIISGGLSIDVDTLRNAGHLPRDFHLRRYRCSSCQESTFHFLSHLQRSAVGVCEQTSFFKASNCACCFCKDSRCSSICFSCVSIRLLCSLICSCCSLTALTRTVVSLSYLTPSTCPSLF